jgi:2-C-methyl-D-erythritol 2,4-cyclodiphosphate synthase
MNTRIGFGFDVHPLKENTNLCIGGLIIPHYKGTVGHSDGDVLIHSICDALLGALNLRDIGVHFPDDDPQFSGIDSKILLKKTVTMVRDKGYEIGNIDTVIVLQAPKIKDYIDEMRKVLCSVMSISEEDLSIKASTTERMGYLGREEGIASYATVLVEKDN